MSKELIDNIYRMSNPEIIGLAKNRFLPPELQMEIARHPYRLGQEHLSDNPELDKQVIEHLWSDECNRGYVFKTNMMISGALDDQPEKFWECYRRYPVMWSKSRWRAMRAFLGLYSWYQRQTSMGTPSDLLQEIYSTHFDPKVYSALSHEGYTYRTALRKMAEHSNCDLALAIKLSMSEHEDVRSAAFKKIVQLS